MDHHEQRDLQATVSAQPDMVVILRLIARSAASLADLTLVDIEDFELAIGEAAALLLPLARPGGHVNLKADIATQNLRITVGVDDVGAGLSVDSSNLAWRSLMYLGLSPTVTHEDAQVSISLQRGG